MKIININAKNVVIRKIEKKMNLAIIVYAKMDILKMKQQIMNIIMFAKNVILIAIHVLIAVIIAFHVNQMPMV